MADELKPCPFCGNAAHIESNGIGDYYVICGDEELGCGASTSDIHCESEEWAIQRWNRRESAGLEANLDRLLEAAQLCVSNPHANLLNLANVITEVKAKIK